MCATERSKNEPLLVSEATSTDPKREQYWSILVTSTGSLVDQYWFVSQPIVKSAK